MKYDKFSIDRFETIKSKDNWTILLKLQIWSSFKNLDISLFKVHQWKFPRFEVTSKILEMLDPISGKWQEFRANGTPCIRLVV